eukprot:SAG31_NODE_346_length_17349_cov_9.825875_6_plen_201_part_00
MCVEYTEYIFKIPLRDFLAEVRAVDAWVAGRTQQTVGMSTDGRPVRFGKEAVVAARKAHKAAKTKDGAEGPPPTGWRGDAPERREVAKQLKWRRRPRPKRQRRAQPTAHPHAMDAAEDATQPTMHAMDAAKDATSAAQHAAMVAKFVAMAAAKVVLAAGQGSERTLVPPPALPLDVRLDYPTKAAAATAYAATRLVRRAL